MTTKPQIAPDRDVRPIVQATKSAPTAALAEAHVVETMESINSRATRVTMVLEKIMAYDSGYRHGGLND